MSMESAKCPHCKKRFLAVQEDDTEERILVTGRPVFVAIQIPGLEGYTTTEAFVVHQCKRKTRNAV